MKLLLDTHIWIWSIHSPEKLGRTVRRELGRASNELYLSPVSIWEAHHLVRRKRLRIRQGFAQWLDDVMAQVPLREAPFTFAVARDPRQLVGWFGTLDRIFARLPLLRGMADHRLL